MAATSGIWMHGSGATPLASAPAADSAGSSSTNSATISANDFLTLLVTEMQNQDPTAATDPNEYINQLVNVNSLQQLISINQTLSSATGQATAANNPAAGKPTPTNVASDGTHIAASGRKTAESAGTGMTSIAAAQGLAARFAPGNLDIPKTNSAAVTVAHALVRH